MNTVKLYFFRHGETDWNVARRIQGSTDIPLNTNGLVQAHDLAERIKHLPVEHLLTSPRLRALQTARIVSHHTNWDMTLLEDLREAHMGHVEGLTREDVIATYGDAYWANWKCHLQESMSFGFREGERKQQVLERVLLCIEQFLLASQFRTVAVSTHGAVLRYVLSHSSNYQANDYTISNCSVFEFDFDCKTKTWKFVQQLT